MPDLRRTENHQGCGRHKRRVQALRQRHPIKREHHQPAAGDADDGAEHGFAAEFQRDMKGRAFADRNQFDQHQRKKYRERIVGAGFDLQRRADPRTQPQALRMHQEKHRRGIGRRHHGAHQQRFGPVQIERILGDRCGDQRGQQHADRRQHHRGSQHRADALKPRSQTAIEQDQRQRHRAHQIGGADVVEPQLPRAGVAGDHADEQEHQQQRRAEPQRQQARQNAGHYQNRAEKNGYADRIERGHELSQSLQILGKYFAQTLRSHPYRRHSSTPTHFSHQRQCARFAGLTPCIGVLYRWRRRRGYGNLRDIRIKLI